MSALTPAGVLVTSYSWLAEEKSTEVPRATKDMWGRKDRWEKLKIKGLWQAIHLPIIVRRELDPKEMEDRFL